jgi:menaquinone-specific isochorismate synthase
LSSRFGRSPVQAPANVTTSCRTTSFGELLAAAADGARQLDGDGVLSLALPLPARDPLALLSQLEESDRFRFLWDGAPGLCLAASGRTNSLELSGPRRFELAQRFSAVSLSRLAAPQACPPLARPRVLLAFAFFDSPLQEGEGMAGVQAVLPRWQLSRQGRHCWLRLQRTLGGDVTARSLAEELWEQAQRLTLLPADPIAHAGPDPGPAIHHRSAWQEGYRSVVERGLELVESGSLRKLVPPADLSRSALPLPVQPAAAGSRIHPHPSAPRDRFHVMLR